MKPGVKYLVSYNIETFKLITVSELQFKNNTNEIRKVKFFFFISGIRTILAHPSYNKNVVSQQEYSERAEVFSVNCNQLPDVG